MQVTESSSEERLAAATSAAKKVHELEAQAKILSRDLESAGNRATELAKLQPKLESANTLNASLKLKLEAATSQAENTKTSLLAVTSELETATREAAAAHSKVCFRGWFWW